MLVDPRHPAGVFASGDGRRDWDTGRPMDCTSGVEVLDGVGSGRIVRCAGLHRGACYENGVGGSWGGDVIYLDLDVIGSAAGNVVASRTAGAKDDVRRRRG